MKQKSLVLIAFLLIILLIIAYCRPIDPAPVVTPTITPAPTITNTPTIEPIITASPSPTSIHTNTPTSTTAPTNTLLPTNEPTNTPVPTPILLPSFYVVQAGDNLSWISQGLCGYQAWHWLYSPNRTMIDDPNLIFRGQQLKIPWPCRK